eukprot:403370532
MNYKDNNKGVLTIKEEEGNLLEHYAQKNAIRVDEINSDLYLIAFYNYSRLLIVDKSGLAAPKEIISFNKEDKIVQFRKSNESSMEILINCCTYMTPYDLVFGDKQGGTRTSSAMKLNLKNQLQLNVLDVKERKSNGAIEILTIESECNSQPSVILKKFLIEKKYIATNDQDITHNI